MKAVLCSSYGPPENLTLEEIAEPIAGEGEALVEVYAASLNFPDGLQIQGKYQFQPPMPFTPGSEVGGVGGDICGGLGIIFFLVLGGFCALMIAIPLMATGSNLE